MLSNRTATKLYGASKGGQEAELGSPLPQWVYRMANERDRLAEQKDELLSALIELRRLLWSEGYADQTPEMAQADAAIAKAEGKGTILVTVTLPNNT